MAERLPEELVLEIIIRLPIKEAVQCSSLNKSFHSLISSPEFARKHALLSSSSSTTVFHCSASEQKSFSIVNSPTAGTVHKSIKLATGIQILSSCNGVFLLCSISPVSKRRYYVFNPLTTGIRPVDFPIYSHSRLGLAVDFPAKPSSSEDQYHFKLVEVDLKTESTHQCVLEFRVFAAVSGGGGNMVVKSTAALACRSFTPAAHGNARPVYAHGCLHWIGNGGMKTAAFHVENARPRMIDGPVRNDRGRVNAVGLEWFSFEWFGLAGGSLHFIQYLPEKLVVHSLDHLKDEWRVAHTILKPCIDGFKYARAATFDGRRLFLHLRNGNKRGEIHAHDLASGEWNKSGATVKNGVRWNPIFSGYAPTLARVSDVYLCGMTEEERRTQEVLAFIGLHWLVGDADLFRLAFIDALGYIHSPLSFSCN